MPLDHWALIATAKLLPHCAQADCAVSRAELIGYAARLSDSLLRGQVENGSFHAAGRTAPTATRMEGLRAALEFLPADATGLRAGIQAAVDHGVAFLLRAQIASGPYAGGMPEAMSAARSIMFKAPPGATEIRIDYVQHALCAWLRHQKFIAPR